MVEANDDERARTRKHGAVGREKGKMGIVLEVRMKENTKRIKGKEDVYEKELQT
jgi:hypothetical protein